MDRILIAGTHSGCGKTTVTTGLLYALKQRGLDISAFKCGPDYIDPMFHREAIGIPSYNLDPFFLNEEQLRRHFTAHHREISIMEGVMGYYDGIGIEGRASTYDIARMTNTPVILVINAKGMYTSAGAILQGFLEYRQRSNIRGVVFNSISQGMYTGLAQIAENAGVQPLGFLPNCEEIRIGSRHLGLVTAAELCDLQERIKKLGELAEQHMDINGILDIAKTAPVIREKSALPAFVKKVPIAVAQDKAFCFIYPENIKLMEAMGAEIIPFSPLEDKSLPESIGGLYLCGGYPELYKEQLSQNHNLLKAIRNAVADGLPTIAECGGFMYLSESLDGFPMVGALPAKAYRTDKLQRFGYITLTARQDNLLCKAGENIPAHEFHYYDSTDCGNGFIAANAGNAREHQCIHARKTLYAGFPHLYFPANPAFAESFIRKAAEYVARHA